MAKKPPGTAVDPRNGQRYEIERKPLEKFDPPAEISESARQIWDEYWQDPVCQLLTPSDRGMLVRWIKLVNDRDRLLDMARMEPVTVGSVRQKTAHPSFSTAMTMEKAIQVLESQLGIGPKNRAALGIAVISERRSMADLNTEFEEIPDEDDDPRMKIIRGEVA